MHVLKGHNQNTELKRQCAMRMFFECNRILITEHDEGKKHLKCRVK
jgi:hypothetical protein